MPPATIKHVAVRAGVSVGTVSNYLNRNKRIAPLTLARIEAAIKELGFVPNSAVRVMKGSRNKVIGLIVPDAANAFFTEISRGIEDVALLAGLVLVTCNTDGDPTREAKYVRAMTELRATGIVITPTEMAPSDFAHFKDGGGVTVLLDERSPSNEFPSLSVDNVAGGRMAMDHLLDLGHRNIAFVGGPGGEHQVRDRFAGARASLAERNLSSSRLTRLDATGNDVSSREQAGLAIAAMSNLPTAVFCANDMIALAVENALLRRGISVPNDVAIIGYDDVEHARLAAVPLSSIRVPKYELGTTAARMILGMGDGQTPEESMGVEFVPELVARASTIG
jgi:LacI family transcriptional regulator